MMDIKLACHPDQVAGFSPTPPFEIGEGVSTNSSLSLHEKPPIIGDIKRGRDFGLQDSHKWIWLPCESCGFTRWVRMINGKPRNRLCQNCGSRGHLAELGKKKNTWFTSERMKGQRLPSETRRKVSQRLKGRHLSIEHRQHLREANLGKKLSTETIEKMKLRDRPKKERIVKGCGYIGIYCPNHPSADKYGRALEHRVVMEREMGRYLTPEEVVHHINEDKTDNRIENLQLFANTNLHTQFHMRNK